MSKRVFISHSCKDLELEAGAGASPTPEAEARLQRLRYAQRVRDRIVAGLKTKNFTVLFDRDRLEPGDAWRAKLHYWLGVCDAAVLLLNRESVRSAWVRKEATVLQWRHSLRPGLLVVPVYLGDFASAELAANGFDPIGLSETQAARLGDTAMTDPNAELLAEQALRKFAALAEPEQDDPMRRWTEDVAAALVPVGSIHLDRARRALRIADQDWADRELADDQERRLLLAHQLLHADLAGLLQALKALKPSFAADKDSFLGLVREVFPGWVDVGAARRLLAPSAAAPQDVKSPPVLALNASEPAIARDYVNRAFCYPEWQGRIMEFDPPTGEGQQAELTQALKGYLMTQLGLTPAEEKKLLKLLGMDPFFVLLGSRVSALPGFFQESEMVSWPAQFVLLAGAQFDHALVGDPTVVKVVPELSSDRVEAVESARLYLETSLY